MYKKELIDYSEWLIDKEIIRKRVKRKWEDVRIRLKIIVVKVVVIISIKKGEKIHLVNDIRIR